MKKELENATNFSSSSDELTEINPVLNRYMSEQQTINPRSFGKNINLQK